jgi:flagellar hook-basal body complex protein FliE
MIIPPIGGVGAELSLTGAEGLTGSAQTPGAGAGASSGGTESTSFGSELTDAISSLEKTQQSGDSASQALATGSVKDPESAVVTVEDAQMSMELASQLRTKTTEAIQNIFQTQV